MAKCGYEVTTCSSKGKNGGCMTLEPCKGKIMNQADRIRAMSDEELAMTMMCPNENGLAEIECDKSDSCNCYECLLKWLQSEVEETNAGAI